MDRTSGDTSEVEQWRNCRNVDDDGVLGHADRDVRDIGVDMGEWSAQRRRTNLGGPWGFGISGHAGVKEEMLGPARQRPGSHSHRRALPVSHSHRLAVEGSSRTVLGLHFMHNCRFSYCIVLSVGECGSV